MKICYSVFFYLLFTLTVSNSWAQKPDTLSRDEAVRAVLTRHPSLEQAKSACAAAEANISALKSSLIPSISATGNFNNLGPDYPIPLGGKELSMYPMNNVDAHISVDYVALDFGKRSKMIESGKVSRKIAENRLESIKAALAWRTVRIFDNIRLLEKSIPVKDDEISSLEQHLTNVKHRVESGSATEFDILRTQAQQAQARSARLDLVAELSKSRALLLQLMGKNLDEILYLKDDIRTDSLKINADSLFQSALNSRSEYTMAINQKEAAELQCGLVALENRPVLGLHVQAGVKNGYQPDINMPKPNWVAGLQLSVPIYNGSRAHYHAAEAKENLKASVAAVKDWKSRYTTKYTQPVSMLKQLTRKSISLSFRLNLHKGRWRLPTENMMQVLSPMMTFWMQRTDMPQHSLNCFTTRKCTT